MLLENLSQFLMDLSRTAQCRDGWLRLQNRCLIGGKPVFILGRGEEMNELA